MATSGLIVIDPAILAGKPIIRGTRLSVEFVVQLLAQGWTEADIQKNYSGITHEQITACLQYAADVLGSEKIYPPGWYLHVAGWRTTSRACWRSSWMQRSASPARIWAMCSF
jgi:uncharacterized protein (DUF433 family)